MLVQLTSWAISMVAAVAVFISWGHSYYWQIYNSYQLFPIFGMLAFTLMWGHYIASVIRQLFGLEKEVLKSYFEITSGMVLVFILMHPGLLAWQLWRDEGLLPPGSELNYAGPALKGYILLAMVSLVVFLAYEFYRKFGDRPWWKYIAFMTDLAMVAVLIHALKVGSHLQQGNLRNLWVFYGVTLVVSLGYIYYKKFQPPLVK